jgi:hypothetical protein
MRIGAFVTCDPQRAKTLRVTDEFPARQQKQGIVCMNTYKGRMRAFYSLHQPTTV